MTNVDVVKGFFSSYSNHDWAGMGACLDPQVEFQDLAFKNLAGDDVRAMWRWYCQPTETRKEPIQVPGFEIFRIDGDQVAAEYWVRYLLGGKHLVNYVIHSELTLQNGKIVRQIDRPVISNFEFARMAMGVAGCLLALTPAFRPVIRTAMRRKLNEFKTGQ